MRSHLGGAPRVLVVQQYFSHAKALAALGRGAFDEAYRETASISPTGTLPPLRAPALWVVLELVDAAVKTGRTAEAAAHVAAVSGSRPDISGRWRCWAGRPRDLLLIGTRPARVSSGRCRHRVRAAGRSTSPGCGSCTGNTCAAHGRTPRPVPTSMLPSTRFSGWMPCPGSAGRPVS